MMTSNVIRFPVERRHMRIMSESKKPTGVIVPANTHERITIPNTPAGRYLIYLAMQLADKVKTNNDDPPAA